MEKEKSFLNLFKPFRKKYTYKNKQGFFGNDWITNQSYLTEYLILKAIVENTAIGYFSNNNPDIVSIDIDDHSAEIKPAYILNIYNQVCSKFGYPSILAQSPRGLHLHYALSERLPANIIKELSEKKLKSIPCEVRGTPDLSLRIPGENRLLNPVTLCPLKIGFEELPAKINYIHPAILFDQAFLPETIKQNLQDKKRTLKKITHAPRVEQIEQDHMPIMNGLSNQSYLKIVSAYILAGYDIDEAFYRFQLLFEKSYLYTGDLRNPVKLMNRLKSSYKNFKAYEYKTKIYQPSLFDTHVSEALKKEYFNSCLICIPTLNNKSGQITQKSNSLKRLVTKILKLKAWHDYISNER